MVSFYAVQIRLGRIRIEDVPEVWRLAVRAWLEGDGGHTPESKEDI